MATILAPAQNLPWLLPCTKRATPCEGEVVAVFAWVENCCHGGHLGTQGVCSTREYHDIVANSLSMFWQFVTQKALVYDKIVSRAGSARSKSSPASCESTSSGDASMLETMALHAGGEPSCGATSWSSNDALACSAVRLCRVAARRADEPKRSQQQDAPASCSSSSGDCVDVPMADGVARRAATTRELRRK